MSIGVLNTEDIQVKEPCNIVVITHLTITIGTVVMGIYSKLLCYTHLPVRWHHNKTSSLFVISSTIEFPSRFIIHTFIDSPVVICASNCI